MAISSKKINTVLLILAICLLAGSLVYRQWNDYQSSKIGVEIGAMAPDFELPDTEGNLIKLSSLRGNYVLVDFWAAWCRPCRQENPNLMHAYEKFSPKKMKGGTGFKILSVSADESKDAWLNAINQDMLKGPIHVSDLQGWASPVFGLYGIRSIPNNLLLDPEGHVLAFKLRGDDLHEELEKYVESSN